MVRLAVNESSQALNTVQRSFHRCFVFIPSFVGYDVYTKKKCISSQLLFWLIDNLGAGWPEEFFLIRKQRLRKGKKKKKKR